MTLQECFEINYIVEPTGCWRMPRTSKTYGYSVLNHKNKTWRAHRLSWLLYRGKLIKGVKVLHECGNKWCVNPKHLYLKTDLTTFEHNYVVESSGCWMWTASMIAGHGNSSYNGEQMGAHRVSWLLHRGEIPKGLHVLHKCNTKLCVNPDHLYLGTQADNNADVRAERIPCGQALNRSDVVCIKKMLRDRIAARLIAWIYEAPVAYIFAIRRGTYWAEVTI